MAARCAQYLILFFCFCGTAVSQTTVIRRPPGLIELYPKQKSAFIVQQPIGHDLRSFILSDGRQVLLLHSEGQAKIVLLVFANGPEVPIVRQVVLLVEPDSPGPSPPEPEPQPSPDPETRFMVGPVVARAFAEFDRQAIAEVFASCATQIASGRFRDTQAVVDHLRQSLSDLLGVSEKSQAAYNQYAQAMRKAAEQAKVISKTDYQGACTEIAEWLRK